MNRQAAANIWVVIVTYNGSQWMDACLESLKASVCPLTVLVVDNCSTDQTVSIIEQKYPEVRLIRNLTNTGFGQANNLGMKKALDEGADYIFLMNQDAWINPDAIQKLAEVAQENATYGVISPIHMNGKGTELDFGFSRYTGFDSLDSLRAAAGNKPLIEVHFVNAAFWLIPAKVLRITGGFDSLFFYCGEDVNLAQRIRYHGFKIGYVPASLVCHDRENRPASHQKEVQINIIYHLSESLNIFHSGFRAFLNGYAALWKRAAVGFFTLHWSDFYHYKLASIRLFLKSWTIWKHRRESRQTNRW